MPLILAIKGIRKLFGTVFSSTEISMNDSSTILEKFNKARRTSTIFNQLIEWLDLSERSRNALLKQALNDGQINALMIRDVPSEICNLVICSELKMKFGTLDGIDGFTKTEFGGFRLDLNIRYGLIAPERNRQGQIRFLRIFRHVRDERSFRLRSRNLNYSGGVNV